MLNRKIYRTSCCVDINKHILTLINFENKNKQIFNFYDNGFYYEIFKHTIYDDIIEIIVKRQNYENLSIMPTQGHRTIERVNVYLLGTNLNYAETEDGFDNGLIIDSLSYRNYEITLK